MNIRICHNESNFNPKPTDFGAISDFGSFFLRLIEYIQMMICKYDTNIENKVSFFNNHLILLAIFRLNHSSFIRLNKCIMCKRII